MSDGPTPAYTTSPVGAPPPAAAATVVFRGPSPSSSGETQRSGGTPGTVADVASSLRQTNVSDRDSDFTSAPPAETMELKSDVSPTSADTAAVAERATSALSDKGAEFMSDIVEACALWRVFNPFVNRTFKIVGKIQLYFYA